MKAPDTLPTLSTNGKPGQTSRRFGIRDVRGKIVAIHERMDGPAGKQFRWLKPEGTPGLNGVRVTELPLYGSARLAKLSAKVSVIVTEGEKACEALWRRGHAAVGTVTGANAIPSDEALRPLLGHPVLLWPDNDEPGHSHMQRIAERLQAMGHNEVFWIEWADAPAKADAADFDGTDEALTALLDAAEPVTIAERFTLTNVADVVARRVAWLWPRRVPLGKLTVLDGDPGLGKSLLTLDLAARVSKMRAMPDGSQGDLRGPCAVVILSAEDDPSDTIRPRLEAAGANLSRIGILSAVRDAEGHPRPPHLGDSEILRAAIKKVNAALVIVDPLMAFIPEDRDSHRDQDIRRALAPLATLANETGAAIVVVRHLNKTPSGNPLYRGGGSIGIIGAARSGLLLARDPDDPTGKVRVLASTKSNLSASCPSLRFQIIEVRPGVPKIDWIGESNHTAGDLLAAAQEDENDRRERDEVKDWLREVLSEGPVAAKDVFTKARQVGLSEKTVRRTGKSLCVLIEKKSFTEGWSWSLPPESDESPKAATMTNAPKMPSTQHVDIFEKDAFSTPHNPAKIAEDGQDAEDARLRTQEGHGHLRADVEAAKDEKLHPHLAALPKMWKGVKPR